MNQIVILVICSIVLQVAVITSADEAKCIPTDGAGAGQLSDAEFWKGVDGANFITELDDSNYSEFIEDTEKNPKIFVMYYTTWCGYSKKARKGFAGAAKKMNKNLKFASVDCDKAPTTCQGTDPAIQGYPTFFFFKDGAFNDEYNGQRNTNDFTKYLKNKIK